MLSSLPLPISPAIFFSSFAQTSKIDHRAQGRAWTEIAKLALARGLVLLFQDHPAITPMLREMAQNVGIEGCFVLAFKAGHGPMETWARGACVAVSSMDEALHLPNLRAGVFIGGDDQALYEALAFARLGLPRYAVASTGGAAWSLYQDQSFNQVKDPTLLEELQQTRSFTALATRILEDLEDQKTPPT